MLEKRHREERGGDGAVSSRAMEPCGLTPTWEGPKVRPSICFATKCSLCPRLMFILLFMFLCI